MARTPEQLKNTSSNEDVWMADRVERIIDGRMDAVYEEGPFTTAIGIEELNERVLSVLRQRYDGWVIHWKKVGDDREGYAYIITFVPLPEVGCCKS